MKRNILFQLLILLGCSAFGQDKNVASLLLPQPVSVKTGDGVFVLNEQTAIHVFSPDASVQRVANFLSGKLSAATGFSMTVVNNATSHGAKNSIELSPVN